MPRAARTDENQKDLVKYLRDRRARVHVTSMYGGLGFDFIAVYMGGVAFCEVKNPDKPKADRRLTENEKAAQALYGKRYYVLETIDDCARMLGQMRGGSMNQPDDGALKIQRSEYNALQSRLISVERRLARLETFGKAKEVIEPYTAGLSVSPEEILSGLRTKSVVKAKHCVWARMHLSGMSLREIGRHFSCNHTAVRHGVRAHKKSNCSGCESV